MKTKLWLWSVWAIGVSLYGLHAQETPCFTQKQIDSKIYAVRVSKDYVPKGETSSAQSFGGRIHTLKVKEGNNFDVISFGTQGARDFKLYEVKHDKNGDPAWAYDKKGLPTPQKGKLIAKIAYLDRFDDVVEIETSTPGSSSVGGIVSFMLDNGTAIEYTIQEDVVGSDRFYDDKGKLHFECEALENN
ncbi:hypothetical protein [uncultured Helicobacter sp.]|uniref:hypothetical protein n=2 Tax=uncultured Helicobacter sp. TaxID=175537 RepID=UPI00374E6408